MILKKILSVLNLIFLLNECYPQFSDNHINNFQKKIIEEEITGSNVALVFRENKIVYYNIENSLKKGDKSIDSETIFPIWSMSKPITIVAIMTLHEKGLIDFDDLVSKYIPSFETLLCENDDGSIYKCKKKLKIIHLMNHTSGLKYYDDYYIEALASENLEDFVSKISKHPIEFEPGEKYLYGINQSILGRIIEVASGQLFYDYLKEVIFDPLEMKDTKFYLTEDDEDHFQPLFINNGIIKGFSDEGITGKGDILTYDIDKKVHLGGEGLVSTFMDYFKFCRMLLNGGSYDGKKIISQKSIDMMVQKQTDGYPYEDKSFVDLVGFYNAFSLFVLEEPINDLNASIGIFGWAGYHNTVFWIDPEKSMFALFMSRSLPSNWRMKKRFMKAVYEEY